MLLLLLLRRQVVLIPSSRVLSGPSRQLEQPSGIFYRGGELIALQGDARKDLGHPLVHPPSVYMPAVEGSRQGVCRRGDVKLAVSERPMAAQHRM